MKQAKTYTKPVYPDDWPVIAFEASQRANHTCQICGLVKGSNNYTRFSVHHDDHNTFNNHPSNLLYLCNPCHLRQEGKYRSRLRADRLYNEIQASGQLLLDNFATLVFPKMNTAGSISPMHSRGPGIEHHDRTL